MICRTARHRNKRERRKCTTKDFDSPTEAREALVIDALVNRHDECANLLDALKETDFRSTGYRAVFVAARKLRDAGKPVSFVTLCDAGNGLMDTLIDCNGACVSVELLQTVVPEMQRYAMECRVKDKLVPLQYEAPEDLLGYIESVVQEERSGAAQETSFEQHIEGYLAGLDVSVFGNRIETGFKKLDRTVGGLPKGAISIIGARPGVGKTQFALNIAVRAIQNQKRVFLASLEMARDQIFDRMATMMSGVPYSTINQHGQNAEERKRIEDAMRRMLGWGGAFDVYDNLYSVDAIIAQIARTKPELAVVDFLQYMSTDGRAKRHEALADIVRRFKQAARLYNVHIMVLSQLNRESEMRTAPKLADLKESGAIEEGGDVIILLHRPGMVDQKEYPKEYMQAIVAKNKYGRTGAQDMKYWLETQRIVEDA